TIPRPPGSTLCPYTTLFRSSSLNFLYRSLSPVVDSDGDGTADSAITLKELDYTLSAGVMQSINQKLGQQGSGDFLTEEDYVFQADSENKTTITVEGRVETHHFNAAGYEGSEDDAGNGTSTFQMEGFRPFEQTDAKGNPTDMLWSADGKRLESV